MGKTHSLSTEYRESGLKEDTGEMLGRGPVPLLTAPEEVPAARTAVRSAACGAPARPGAGTGTARMGGRERVCTQRGSGTARALF